MSLSVSVVSPLTADEGPLEPVSVVRSVRLQPDQALVGLTPLVRLKPDTTYL
jgi:hypothetical protein